MFESDLRWNAVFQEIRNIHFQLQELEERKESYDLIFTTRLYAERLQRTLDSLTPHFLQTTGAATEQLKLALAFIHKNMGQLAVEVEKMKHRAESLLQAADEKNKEALSLKVVADAIEAQIRTPQKLSSTSDGEKEGKK